MTAAGKVLAVGSRRGADSRVRARAALRPTSKRMPEPSSSRMSYRQVDKGLTNSPLGDVAPMQQNATEHCEELTRLTALLPASGLVVVAGFTVPYVELIADDRKQHGMHTIKEETIFNRVQTDVGGEIRGTAAIPAALMSCSGISVRNDHAVMIREPPIPDKRLICSFGGRTRAAMRRLRRRRNPPCISTRAPAPLSATASGDTR